MRGKINIISRLILVILGIFAYTTFVEKTAYAETIMSVRYQTHVQNIGWQDVVGQGVQAGTTGQALRIEGIKMYLDNAIPGVKLKYQAYVENIGWQDWSESGNLSGTSGQALRLEAIRIILEGAPKDYHIYYQVHVQNIGWQSEVNDGQVAGTLGQALRIESIKARVVKDYSTNLDVSVKSHVQNIGWQNPVGDDQVSGTSGQSLRVEGIKIQLNSPIQGMKIRYQTHVENIGWQDWVDNGQLAGTTGQALRLEAIRINLEGAPKNYHVEYQAHVQNIGWTPWVRDGEASGSTGQGLRMEAIRVRIVNTEYTNARSINDLLLQYTFDSKVQLQVNKGIAKDAASYYLDSNNFRATSKVYQFLRNDRFYTNVNENALADFLDNLKMNTGKVNVFRGKAGVFIGAAKKNNIDVLYLVAHAMWETGYGNSTLAQGILVSTVNGKAVEPKTTYNFYGIGAYDSGANLYGSQAAYVRQWYTPEDAIYGGAKWISDNYIHSSYNQHSLYTMKWSYAADKDWHQYATDPNWANGIGKLMGELSYIYRDTTFEFEVPKYK